MPALPNIPNVLKAQLLWQDNADNQVTTNLYFRYSGSGPDAVDAANLATVLCNSFAPAADLWSLETTLIGAKVTDLSTNTGGEGSATANVPGTNTGAELAGGTAVVVNYAINRRYRGGKPRSYFPWGCSSNLDGRQLWGTTFISNVVSAVETAMSTFIGTSEGSTTITAHVNVSYYSGFESVQNPVTKRWRNVPTPRTTPVVDEINGVSVLTNPGSQRRRNR